MERLGEDLRAELRRLGAPEGGHLATIVAAWRELAGETVSRNAWPLRIGSDGTLHVAASSSTWAFELGRLAPALLVRLRERLGDAAPTGLRFAPGPLPEAAEPDPTHVPEPPQVTGADRVEAAGLVAELDDDALRELLSRAAAAALARGRSDRRF